MKPRLDIESNPPRPHRRLLLYCAETTFLFVPSSGVNLRHPFFVFAVLLARRTLGFVLGRPGHLGLSRFVLLCLWVLLAIEIDFQRFNAGLKHIDVVMLLHGHNARTRR
jgi:hypothetical protein